MARRIQVCEPSHYAFTWGDVSAGEVNEKSHVYAFGMVLLQATTGCCVSAGGMKESLTEVVIPWA